MATSVLGVTMIIHANPKPHLKKPGALDRSESNSVHAN
jgi:hypothetical protein